ncbi:hypothetical protein MBM_04127 [Drepanopeziza brunnea f. sp. 'multigermtubi' MB_m1]|uniref:Uncharacterized protein n=2 Tax=Drepanopeziza brunnea f. sp. 'multigermtubi' TaxID=698441 RepID=K1XAN0_MARBU|nr:uncharacterized protein MBM_04127 [Drepanopeziza brunnea f. sp. 'multigermtubi' MB_m1]EKD17758.1 hypothetical protein MBM_04127 [Drepanopeziza brunnea f. sp. 'multigermtubi' MB_m1]
MLFNTKSIAASLLSLAAVGTCQVNDPNYYWTVSEWNAGTARRGDFYSFNITGFAYLDVPSFSAFCSGEIVGAPLAYCAVNDNNLANRGVAARLLPSVGGDPNIQVSYQFTDVATNAYYNYTGNATTKFTQSVSPPLTFTISPNTSFGVGGALTREG